MLGTLHTILVLAFVTVTALLLSVTVMQRLRIRRVRMTWRSGRVSQLPVWPILFVGVVAVFLVYAQNMYPVVRISIFAGYLLGGILWFVAVLLSSTSIITDYGVVPELGHSGDAIAWGQVSDYFEVAEGRRTFFVFIYKDFLGARRRLELAVPAIEVDRFRGIVCSKLDVCIEAPVQHFEGSKALEK